MKCLAGPELLLPVVGLSLGAGTLGDPLADQLTLFRGHLGDVAERHDLRGHGLGLNLRCQLLDLLRGIEHHARRCGAELVKQVEQSFAEKTFALAN